MTKHLFSLGLTTTFVSGVLLATSSFAAHSEEAQADNFNFNNWYVGGEFGRKRQDDLCKKSLSSCDSSDNAWSVFFGYEFSKHWALEGGYTDLGEYSTTGLVNGLTNHAVTSMTGLEFAGVFRMPLTEQAGLFTKLGAMYYDGEEKNSIAKFDDKGWSALFGLGLSYDFTQNLQGRVEYNFLHDLGDSEFAGDHGHLTTLGLAYRFGSNAKKAPRAPAPVTPVAKVVEPVVVAPVEVAPVVVPAVNAFALFDFDKSAVKETQALKDLAAHLAANPQAQAAVTGYTDSQGSKEYNEKLALRRANAIAKYLTANGVNASQLTVKSVGETDLFASNATIAERLNNRRVTIDVAEFTK
ncbi:OmpA family protein [Pseudoalteromonas tunicata]|uniref:OmpA family protein n=1 Tax=Pseudoalteromonas tunicata TaxID=314281 RepID=UPI00273DCFE7|nr:OmpA family protein [Pseudoalteromonas tunicata]MDP4985837.1 OmpA family protein [Pseudoalteromonas tunicata]MDP5213221.1 OmpA family protein [Pseudoalteromonas tunicata]